MTEPCGRPGCGTNGGYVTDSRGTMDGATRRRRECEHCKHRWTTYELPQSEIEHLQGLRARMARINESMITLFALSTLDKDKKLP